MNHDSYPDDLSARILNGVKTDRAGRRIGQPCASQLHRDEIPAANGLHASSRSTPAWPARRSSASKVYATLADIPSPLDMVEIFRNSDALPGRSPTRRWRSIPLPKVIWMQLSVRNDEAAARAEARVSRSS